MNRRIVVFTDLDGTLLDHHSYRYDDAAPALAALRERAIPLVLCSSKTAAEIAPLRAELGFDHCPAIVENGAGILAAHARVPTPAPRHAELLAILDALAPALRVDFSGFSSWSADELRRHTGLESEAAQRAARRDYSEPGLWRGDAAGEREFIAALAGHGVRAQRGGRFLTLGFTCDKAARMREIVADYEALYAGTVFSIALGDAPNDGEMLEQADRGVVIPNPAHSGVPALAGAIEGRIMRAARAGPAGWSEALLALLDNPGPPKEGA